jgi:hypothetical protein
MTNQGWISLHRKIEDNPIFQNEKALKIWIWVLIRANHTETDILLGRNLIHLKVGQFVFGSDTACERLKMSKSTIHFWLNFLKLERYIERKVTNKYSIITVLNYSRYQTVERQVEYKRNAKRILSVQQNETDNNVDTVNTDNTDNKITLSINSLIPLFEEINPSYKQLFGNTTQRASLKRLVDKYGVDWVEKLLKKLPEITSKPYAPRITNPYELESKLGQLKVFLQQEKAKNSRQGVTKV